MTSFEDTSPTIPSTTVNTSYQSLDLQLSNYAVHVINAILAAFLVLRLYAMWALPFTDSTEARYAEIARKMVETGNWITPQFEYGVPFWGKPPLHTWLAASGMQVFGINEFAARLPLLLTSIALLALIFVWVKQLAGRDTALISVTVLSSMILFFGASAFVMTDMPMALGIALVMVGFWNAVCRDAPNRHWGVAIAVGLSIGMLAKGPVAVILCGIPIVVWLTVMRKWSVLRDLPWVTMTFVFIVLTVPWYIAAEIATPGFLHYFIIGEHFERFVVPGWDGDLYGVGHDQAKGAIWVFFLGISLPWSFALLPLLYRGRKTVRTFTQDRSGLLFYLLMWTLAPLILFTPAANLLPAYGLPGLPAAAILLTLLCAKIWSPIGAVASRTAFLAASSISFAAFASVFVAVTLYPNSPHIKSQLAVITAGYDIAPDYPVYVVGPRRYSAEFYTNGVAKTISPHELPNLQGNAILTVPLSLEEQVATLPYDHIGTFGRYDLFIKTDTVVQP